MKKTDKVIAAYIKDKYNLKVRRTHFVAEPKYYVVEPARESIFRQHIDIKSEFFFLANRFFDKVSDILDEIHTFKA